MKELRMWGAGLHQNRYHQKMGGNEKETCGVLSSLTTSRSKEARMGRGTPWDNLKLKIKTQSFNHNCCQINHTLELTKSKDLQKVAPQWTDKFEHCLGTTFDFKFCFARFYWRCLRNPHADLIPLLPTLKRRPHLSKCARSWKWRSSNSPKKLLGIVLERSHHLPPKRKPHSQKQKLNVQNLFDKNHWKNLVLAGLRHENHHMTRDPPKIQSRNPGIPTYVWDINTIASSKNKKRIWKWDFICGMTKWQIVECRIKPKTYLE